MRSNCAASAPALLLAEPLLIRRPLPQVEERCEAGFGPALIDARIGLAPQAAAVGEACPRG